MTAQLSASVPQEVKNSCLAPQPSASATVFRQTSTRRFISSPMGYWELGLPNCSVSTSHGIRHRPGNGRSGGVVQINHEKRSPCSWALPNSKITV